MSDTELPSRVFADTCILLNFVQSEWEGDVTSELITHDTIDIVISQSVYEEFESVCDRRQNIYPDFLDFLLKEEGEIEDYDPSSRRVYFDSNDVKHIRSIQYELADVEDRREVQYRLRRFISAAESRIEYLKSRYEDEVVDPYVPLGLRFALDREIENSADVRVITDAAAWTANGGSSILVTGDSRDIVDRSEDINEVISNEQDSDWALVISIPQEVLESGTTLLPS
jgi:predicted nucleic acid-binding protein